MTQAILVSNITFVGIAQHSYTHIKVYSPTDFTIEEIPREEALEIIPSLTLASKESYLGEYVRSNGKIYASEDFQEYLNKNISLKHRIINFLDEN